MDAARLLQNHGNYIVSLANVVRWLGQQAEELGVEIYPGFAAAEILHGGRRGTKASRPATWAWAADGSHRELPARHRAAREVHLFAEGSRSHLGHQLFARYDLAKDADPQSYGIG